MSEREPGLFSSLDASSESGASADTSETGDTSETSATSKRDPSRFVDADAREMIRSALGETLAVEAAAGTGKTTVLVDRIINVIAQGTTTVDQIVAVTFTEKAAGELKLRLRAKLDAERMKLSSSDVHAASRRANLDAALANLEQAHVSTIHGFCADLLRERPVEARVDPQFTTLTETQSERLYGDVFRDWLQQQLEAPPEGVRRALRRPSFDAENGPIKRLERAGWTLVDWRDFTTPWRRDPFNRFGAIDALVAQLEQFTALTKAPADRRDPFFDSTEDARRLFDEITRAESPIPGDDETLRPRSRPRDYDGLEARLVSLNSWRFREIRQGRRTSPYSKGVSRADVIAAHQALVERLEAFQRAADADLAALLQRELRETVDRYEVAKARLGALDFLDLLIRARDLVRDHDEVRAAFQQRFTHLFIDEFQDTDPLQAELLLLLAAEDPAERIWRDVVPTRGKLFIVGDPKQSIYRFRRADVGVYQDVRDQLARHGAKLLTLTTSFRSLPMIQRAVNAGFAPSMQGDRAALQADYVPLSAARDDLEGQPSVVALPVPRPYGDRGYITKAAIGASLPDAVGAFVDWLITKSGWTVTEREHPDRRAPIQARHVCLLFRRFDTRVFGRGESWMEDVTRPYVQALEARGVPHVLVGGKSFHDREEVETMRTALAAIEWPEDELSVFGTLRGSLFAIDDETLFAYRRHARRISPFRGGVGRASAPVDGGANAGGGTNAGSAANADGVANSGSAASEVNAAAAPDRFRVVEEALDVLRELHVRRNYRPVPETIARLLDASRAHVALVLRPSGEQALANVQYIAEMARQYEASGGISFRGFVEQLRDEAASVRSAEAPILEEGSEGVRLMTVHRAKGLEFPIVILADTTAELSRKTASRWVDAQSGRCAVSLAGWAPADLRDHEAEEVARDQAEGVRVAYVAATRARDLLVIPAVGDAPQGGWVSPLNDAIYPAGDVRRDPAGEGAPGCPSFSKDSIYDREGTIPFTSVCPGRHRLTPNPLTLKSSGADANTGADAGADAASGDYDVVWWDPASLDLDRPPNYGLRREELIAKDAPPAVIAEGQGRYYTWRAAREGALERGATPTQRIVTVRARAATVGDDGEPGDHADEHHEHEPHEMAPEHDAESREELPPVEVVDVRSNGGEGAGGTRPSGVRFGALVHAVLALVPLDAADEAVRRLAAQQARVLGGSAAERDACGPAVIAALRHPLFARARAARDRGRLRRETPLAFLDARNAIVEGVIDLAFEEDAGWVVVDFKTDYELTGVPLDTYRRQVALYAAGIARATGRPASGILLRL
jgi:ATP-dependent helicase/nuclease subunit A